jgi:hypothetical protein
LTACPPPLQAAHCVQAPRQMDCEIARHPRAMPRSRQPNAGRETIDGQLAGAVHKPRSNGAGACPKMRAPGR